MRLLLDTHIILWLLTDDRRLSDKARSLLEMPARDVHFSVASLWEIAIKSGLGNLDFSPGDIANGMRDSGYSRLPILDSHLERIVSLPHHHRDPFDRMLIAQAEVEPLILVTVDKALSPYGSFIQIV